MLPKGGQVPWGTDPPGHVRFFNAEGQQKSTVPFEIPESYQLSDKLGTFELFGDRCTKLGGKCKLIVWQKLRPWQGSDIVADGAH